MMLNKISLEIVADSPVSLIQYFFSILSIIFELKFNLLVTILLIVTSGMS